VTTAAVVGAGATSGILRVLTVLTVRTVLTVCAVLAYAALADKASLTVLTGGGLRLLIDMVGNAVGDGAAASVFFVLIHFQGASAAQ